MINSIKNYVKKEILGNESVKLKVILLSGASEKKFSKGRIAVLVFKEHEDNPFLVCKFSKEKSYESSIVNEYTKTMELYDTFPEYIPRPIALVSIDNKLVFVQEAVNGRSVSNILFNAKNSLYFNKDIFDNEVASNVHDIKEIIIKLNSISSESNIDRLTGEIDEIKDSFIGNYGLNGYEILTLNKSIQEFKLLFENKRIFKRITNFDFTTSNVISNGEKNFLIDFEYAKESTLTIIEGLRYVYYLYRILHELGESKFTDNLIHSYYLFLSDFQNPIVKEVYALFKEVYGIDINRKTRKLLCLIFFMVEANMQYEVGAYISKDYVKNWKRIVNYFSGAYSEEEIFDYENSLVSELNHFLSIKDIQVNQCESYIEELEGIIRSNEGVIREKEKKVLELTDIINCQDNIIIEKEELTERFKGVIREKEKKVLELTGVINYQEKIMIEKEKLIERLEYIGRQEKNMLEESKNNICMLNMELTGVNEAFTEKVKCLEDEINNIKSRKIWKVISFLDRLRAKYK